MRRPWRAAAATLELRLGRLVGVAAEGLVGWGDCAPLPSSGEAGHERAFAALRKAASRMHGALVADAFALLGEVGVPEARWALETALLDLQLRERGLSIRQALRRDAPDFVQVNVALGPLDDTCDERAVAAHAQGFVFAKIKVGLSDAAGEGRRLIELSRRVGHRLRLRLDANRAWSEDEAARLLDAISDLPVDGVEEPLARPTLDRLAALQKRTRFALAIDESLFEIGAEALFAARAVRRLVLKPARIGGFGATLRLADRARAAGLEAVVTSVVDSAIGVAAAAQLAAASGADIAHGLATGAWLARDVARPLEIDGGVLHLPVGAGLGVAPTNRFA